MSYATNLARKLGARKGLAMRRSNKPHSRPRKSWFYQILDPERDPNDLCGGRRLEGAEFERRKAELEARDAAERTRW